MRAVAGSAEASPWRWPTSSGDGPPALEMSQLLLTRAAAGGDEPPLLEWGNSAGGEPSPLEMRRLELS